MLIVKKFGGTSVGNTERIFNVAKRCIEDWQKGNDVVVVLSAMGKYTDELIDMAKQVNENPPKREMDMLFTIGEQMSVSLMAMAMNSLKVPAISLNAFQVAMHTTSVYGNARLKRIDVERIRHELEQRKIVIVTGFQGINKYDDYTTLGRGGSDTTAVALAAALNADACEIYTDVDGVYTADPRKVPNARKLKEITYDEMLDLATSGAGVLHNRSVEMAKKYGVPLVVRSSLNNSEGTVVKEEVKMEKLSLDRELKENAYPGRGIVIGISPDGKKAVTAYFIMGRSSNSRNRVFVEHEDGIRTEAFDPSKLEDPSLIIYAPVRVLGDYTIVTNGDQTDTIYDGMRNGLNFEQALRSREFEPDAPNYTPRISGSMELKDGKYRYAMSILKSDNGNPESCNRFAFYYNNPVAGEGRFIHTYMHDGNPLPSFEGEPKLVEVSDDIDEYTNLIWNSLNEENKVSLFVRYIDIATGKYETRIVNKNQK